MVRYGMVSLMHWYNLLQWSNNTFVQTTAQVGTVLYVLLQFSTLIQLGTFQAMCVQFDTDLYMLVKFGTKCR